MYDWLRFVDEMRLPLYQAGRVALALQGRVAPERKPKDSPLQESVEVSLADRLCQEVLLLAAHRCEPRLSAYSEEWAACPEAIRALFPADGRYVLVLDPLDGSADYLAGLDTFGAMLGVLDRDTGRMVAGLLYLPVPGRLLAGVAGVGAWESNGYWGAATRLRGRAPSPVVLATKRMLPSDAPRLAEAGFRVVADSGRSCAWGLARVVRGEAAGYVMRGFHGHDSAVGALLLECIGGAALGSFGQPVRYTADMPRLPLVVLAHRASDAARIWEAIRDG